MIVIFITIFILNLHFWFYALSSLHPLHNTDIALQAISQKQEYTSLQKRTLHRGHLVLDLNQWSMQSLWKRCMQGRVRNVSPCVYSLRQMEQVVCSAADVDDPGMYACMGNSSSMSCDAPLHSVRIKNYMAIF